jgi:hypothetical protein
MARLRAGDASNHQGEIMRKTAILLLTIVGLGVALWAQQAGFRGTRTVVLAEQAKVGAQVLPAGQYRVTHTMEGAEHIMVFKGAKQEYRIKCNLQPLQEKADNTQYYYEHASGERVLEAIVFRGDTVRHVFGE